MGIWQKWTRIANGPYQGVPKLTPAGQGESGYVIDVRDRAGNVIRHFPAKSGGSGTVANLGGANLIAHLGLGPTRMGGFLATGSDNCLYHIESNGSQYRWQKTFGPGQFLGSVSSWATLDGEVEVLGEGTEHQLAYAYLAPEQDRDNIRQWEDLGQPGKARGKKGLNGRPAVLFDGLGLHVLARGQDNHLWHTFGEDNNLQEKRAFGDWTNLGGSLTQAPVAIRTQGGIECFVIGENGASQVNTWDGTHWRGFDPLGSQIKGLPAAIYVRGSDSTFLFGRGWHGRLWYCRRNWDGWQAWQAIGEDPGSEPALWVESLGGNGEGLVSCVVLRQNGELWRRELQLTRETYSG